MHLSANYTFIDKSGYLSYYYCYHLGLGLRKLTLTNLFAFAISGFFLLLRWSIVTIVVPMNLILNSDYTFPEKQLASNGDEEDCLESELILNLFVNIMDKRDRCSTITAPLLL